MSREFQRSPIAAEYAPPVAGHVFLWLWFFNQCSGFIREVTTWCGILVYICNRNIQREIMSVESIVHIMRWQRKWEIEAAINTAHQLHLLCRRGVKKTSARKGCMTSSSVHSCWLLFWHNGEYLGKLFLVRSAQASNLSTGEAFEFCEGFGTWYGKQLFNANQIYVLPTDWITKELLRVQRWLWIWTLCAAD